MAAKTARVNLTTLLIKLADRPIISVIILVFEYLLHFHAAFVIVDADWKVHLEFDYAPN